MKHPQDTLDRQFGREGRGPVVAVVHEEVFARNARQRRIETREDRCDVLPLVPCRDDNGKSGLAGYRPGARHAVSLAAGAGPPSG